MKRQTESSLTSRVYTYGAVPERIAPVIGEEAALKQMRLAAQLWNVLVKVERTRVARYRAIMHDANQDAIDVLNLKIDALRKEILDRRKVARKRKGVDVSDLKEAVAAAKTEIGALIDVRRATAAARHDARRAELTANTERSYRRIKRARQAAARMGLFWGTYNEIVQRADAGRKHGGELHFRGFRGEGTLTAQIMGGAPTERCFGGGTFFRIEPIVAKPPAAAIALRDGRRRGAFPNGRPHSHGCECRACRPTEQQARLVYGCMRIGSVGREPIWLKIPVAYHRDLPEDASIRSVSMTRRLDSGGRPKWQLNVTVNVPRAAPRQGIAVACNIGWRLLPEGVRVAYWVDETGRKGQLVVPTDDIAQFERVRSIRSACDLSREEMLPALVDWLAGQELPPEWRERTAHLIQWRSTARISNLILWWGEHRLAGDEDIYSSVASWRRNDRHLTHYWKNLQSQMEGRTRELYRVFASRLCSLTSHYGTVILEEFNIKDVMEIPDAESDKLAPRNHYAQLVSPARFRETLVNACQREGVAVVACPAPGVTQTCHACFYDGPWDAAPSVIHRCPRCNTTWDQDENAAINDLTWYLDSRSARATA